jgi:hypothetical protein
MQDELLKAISLLRVMISEGYPYKEHLNRLDLIAAKQELAPKDWFVLGLIVGDLQYEDEGKMSPAMMYTYYNLLAELTCFAANERRSA